MDNAVDDGGLLHAYVADGNQEAFAALVNRHARMVHGVCREVLGDSITADDAVQETFLALMRRASELKRDTPLGGWLRVTATSSARQMRRSQLRRLRREQVVAQEQPVAYEHPAPAEDHPAISSALRALPAEQRAALLLRYVDEHSEEEAARIAGCPQRTLHNRVMAGLEKLRWRLRERGLEVSTTALVAMLTTARFSPALPLAPVIASAASAGAAAAGHGLRLSAVAKGVIAASLLTGAAVTALAIVHHRMPAVDVLAPPPAVVETDPVIPASVTSAPAAPSPPAAQKAAPAGDPVAQLYTGASSELTAVAFTADGRLLAAGYDRELLRWQPPSTTPSGIQPVPGAGIRAFALAADGQWAALGNEDGAVRIWDLAAQSVRWTLLGHHDAVTGVAISPDGRHLASTAKDGQLLIWDVASGSREHTCPSGSGWVSAVAWSPDGRTLASVGDDGACSLWDATSGARIRMLRGHSSSLRAVAWSADNAMVASAGGDGQIILWDATSGAQRLRLGVHADVVMAVTMTRDGRLLAACDRGGGCWLWALPTGQLLRHLVVPDVHFNALACSSDAAQLAVTGTDGVVRVWSTADFAH